ncbi:GPN-loop GTPase 2 isoform X2 [Parus major]|uniref:GPN-loop GTPase 2 isoform X2 n=1 Tax=Parus major TaxID=9157 RepID=UPI0014438FE1|nr:GPN-loop GTPase 2 isoform X2 [Parus major]
MAEGSRGGSLAFGQVVIGPPGSGKTTYCHAMRDFLSRIGRSVAVVNLDPANEALPWPCALDIAELVTLPDVMGSLGLGPNGGLIYCMEYLEANADWLRDRLQGLRGHYILFDCPGQVELYTHHEALKNVFAQLAKWNFRLAAVHLVDSHYCTDPGKFISVLCTSLSTMLHVELPHVNVLSKMDLIEQYGKLAFNLDYYTEVLDLSYLLDHLASDPFFRNFRRLNEKLVEVIEDYSLVSFVPLNVQVTQQEGTGSPACTAAAFCLLGATGLETSAVNRLGAGKQGNTARLGNDLWQPKEGERLMSLGLPGPCVLGWGIQAPLPSALLAWAEDHPEPR